MEKKGCRGLLIVLVGAIAVLVSSPERSWPAGPAVSLRKENLVIPTYLVGPPERNPMFYFGRAYQGAKGPVYPYPFLNVLTDKRVDKTYSALVLENEYVRYRILPEIGGRIFEAVDKTNGYDFFYRQHVIKPALIGMLGAWISGGVEWNIPHHHRATTFMPVDWTITETADGSKTVWVGELELRHRMRWLVGLTLRPGSSVLEVAYRIVNRTPFAHSILCWANAAVHANQDYQIIFPPGTGLATFHGKNQFSHWPVSREVYNGVDYTRGVDVSWWKDHPSPTSFFAFGSQEDFFAGYDHGRNAGVVFIGDHALVPGKKLWTWGTGSEGARWEKILTDQDGPYLELMFGSFSDNQPDYSWIGPGEVKTVTQFWYPLRAIGAVKNANVEAACNLEARGGGRVLLGVAVTAVRKNARVVLEAGGKVIFQKTADLAPGTPFTAEVELPPRTEEESLRVSLTADDGRELVGYQPKKRETPSLPAPVTTPPAPPEIGTVEELYLTGLRLEQFYSPALEPYPYYEEALKRDPNDSRVNTSLGRLYLMRGMFARAEEHLLRAVRRASKDYTRLKDGEALYYLGIALRFLGREAEAEEAFGRASWDAGWTAPAGLQIAELAASRGRYLEALEQVERALASKGSAGRARDFKATLLRTTGRLEEGERTARQSLAEDPLDFWAANELRLIMAARGLENESGQLAAATRLRMRGEAESYLELASDYASGGFYAEAVDVLSLLQNESPAEGRWPVLHYDLAFYHHKLNDENGADLLLQKAMKMPPDLAFPFRLEDMAVLRWAESRNPRDGRSPYYLGNLLFDRQPEEAIAQWEKAIALDGTLPTAHRNLGLAYSRVKNDLPRAVASLEKAVARAPSDPRLLLELDDLYDLSNTGPEKRLELLSRNHEAIAGRDDALSREITLLVELGRFDRALELLNSHHFHVWEGGGAIHDVYVDARLGRGERRLEEGKAAPALQDFQAALEYPENLEVGRPAVGGRDPEIFHFIALALGSMGDKERSREAFRRSAEAAAGPTEQAYYQGLSRRMIGEEARARDSFEGLVLMAREGLEKASTRDYFAKFGEAESARRREARFHFLLGLGLRGLKKASEAKVEFEEVLKLYPHFSRVLRMLR